jgi:hypothetical protein
MGKAIRPWCAKAKYKDLKPFIVGTVTLPEDARHDEIISALEKRALEFLPAGFEIIEPLCGALFFHEEPSHD